MTRHSHSHTEYLRAWGYDDIAEAFETSGSSSESIPVPSDWAEAARIQSRIRQAAKALSQLPQGSTLRPLLERMERCFYNRQK